MPAMLTSPTTVTSIAMTASIIVKPASLCWLSNFILISLTLIVSPRVRHCYLAGRRNRHEQVVPVSTVESNRRTICGHRSNDASPIEVDLFGSLGVDGHALRQMDSAFHLRLGLAFRVVLLDVDMLQLNDEYSSPCVVGSRDVPGALKCCCQIAASHSQSIHSHVSEHLGHGKRNDYRDDQQNHRDFYHRESVLTPAGWI